MKRFRRIALWGSVALLVVWLVASAVTCWILTGRPHPLAPEPASLVGLPGLEERHLMTDDGIELGAWFFRPKGTRPAVLLLHGNRASRSRFAKLMPFLAREGAGVLAISLRAHGDSDGRTNDFGYSARRDVIAAVHFLERECPGRPIVIVGESLGAAAALFAARDCAGVVKGYVLAAPYGRLDTAVWNRCDRHLFPPFSQAAYAGLRLWAPAFLPVSTANIAPAEHLLEIPEATPVTVFAAEDDRYARIDEVRTMVESIQKHARLVTVRGGGHGMFLFVHETEYRTTILDLLALVEGRK